MAATTSGLLPATPSHSFDLHGNGHDGDVFSSDADLSSQSYQHRFSSRFEIEPPDFSSTASPSQLKRTIEAHLQDTDRRLQDTQKLGTSLLKQREDLSSKLDELEQFQDEAQIPNDLRRRLADIEREHADVSREVARALIGPKQKQEDPNLSDSGVFTSQATGSPTKISAPSRRHRNQPSTRAGDLQFAADISTSLLAQVRQLQATVAERDDAIKRSQAERESIEQDILGYTQKIRALDENEQKYKDENWNLETQRHELLTATKDAHDKEKRLNANLGSAVAERTKVQNELDELNMAHAKLSEEHAATRKAHDTEIHGLKRNADMADTDRQSLQDRIDELISQNQELAKAISTRSRDRQISPGEGFVSAHEEVGERLDESDESPPPSPTKATPRHGGLESETLRSSLHHAHRMIQNLKNNIHREKTEKIELKRMLQDARDDLEQRRDSGSAAKRQKTKPEPFKKPPRPDMLGGGRRARTDVEMMNDDWEDQNIESSSHARSANFIQTPQHVDQRLNDSSDAYQTANETEDAFDTADERNTTESEAFMTGAESLAGDSTDELTETEDTASGTGRTAPGRVGRTSLAARTAGDRASYLSTASTSADEADMQTPVSNSFTRFKLRNNRASFNKQFLLAQESTPESLRSETPSRDSPATVTASQSPPVGEQSLFAELGGMDEINSDTQSTPARSSTMSSTHSTPGFPYTPSRSIAMPLSPPSRPLMIDSSTMTEPWSGQAVIPSSSTVPVTSVAASWAPLGAERGLLPSAFPLPPSVPTSPIKHTDTSTQYTPQRSMAESPARPTSSHITPPKTVWDEEHESATPLHHTAGTETVDRSLSSLDYSGVLSQASLPMQSPIRDNTAVQRQIEALEAYLIVKEAELTSLKTSHATAIAAIRDELTTLRDTHTSDLADKDAELAGLRNIHATALLAQRNEIDGLRSVQAVHLTKKDVEMDTLRKTHADDLAQRQAELDHLRSDHASYLSAQKIETENLRSGHATELKGLKDQIVGHKQEIVALGAEITNVREGRATDLASKEVELEALRTGHAKALANKQAELDELKTSHSAALTTLQGESLAFEDTLRNREVELEGVRSSHALALAAKEIGLEGVRAEYAAELAKLNRQIATHVEDSTKKRAEIESLRNLQNEELNNLRTQFSGQTQEMGSKQTEFEKLQAVHLAELESLRRQISSYHTDLDSKQEQIQLLRSNHGDELDSLRQQLSVNAQNLNLKQSELVDIQGAHHEERERLQNEARVHAQNASAKDSELDGLRQQLSVHAQTLTSKQSELEDLHTSHIEERERQQKQASMHALSMSTTQSELEAVHKAHAQEIEKMARQITERGELMNRLQTAHTEELSRLQGQIGAQSADLEKLHHALRASEARQAAVSTSAYSSVLAQDIHPVSPAHTAPQVLNGTNEAGDDELDRPRTAEKVVGGGLPASTAGSFDSPVGRIQQPTRFRDDQTTQLYSVHRDVTVSEKLPLNDVSGSTGPNRHPDDVFGGPIVRPTISRDQGSQTTPTAKQVDSGVQARKTTMPPVAISIPATTPGARTPTSPTRYSGRPSSRTREVSPIVEDTTVFPSSPPPRPGSIGSNRTSSIVSHTHPPLPIDHRDVIAKANTHIGSPTRQGNNAIKQGGIMGPPIMPASAMRRPKTPSESVRTANRVVANGKRGTVGSQISRRSSVSSFASELDERFNIRADQQVASRGFEAGLGTDPRMIQAITQTMIGEFLWKYTRKAGSKEMSATRHRRYFWVHPYTKTLYWSDQDPQTAGGNQLKAKSVQIESVRVVSDDNPMPPGLHRKSLEVTTPGRKIKFTASTGQRHETWFNALSYLLHRGEGQDTGNIHGADGNDITADDIAEFSVNGYGARLVPNDSSRMSMSSYNSRTTNGTTRRVRQSLPASATVGSSSLQPPQGQGVQNTSSQANNDTVRQSKLDVPADKDRTIRAGSVSRISKMFGSVTSKTKPDNSTANAEASSQSRENSSIYDASVVSDGRREQEEAGRRQEDDRPGLEDVRACCDGKHHVGSLAHRHTSNATTGSRLSNAINRSMSRRT